MNPIFPIFKKLTLEDQKIIEAITSYYLPYSDFNFTSLYTWDTNSSTQYTILNGNLVILMKDYSSNEKILSFLGNKQCSDTLETLFIFAKQNDISSLKLVPESNLSNHQKQISQKYSIKEDRDSFDYIYKLMDLSTMSGGGYMKQRNKINIFEKNYKAILKEINTSSPKVQKEVLDLVHRWKNLKINESKYFDESEFIAIQKFLTLKSDKFINLGLYIDERLIGFSFFELIHDRYCIFHFEKTNHEFKGITEYLKKNSASHLLSKGGELLNAEQDLGIEGLKKAKELWRPVTLLKKYTINPK